MRSGGSGLSLKEWPTRRSGERVEEFRPGRFQVAGIARDQCEVASKCGCSGWIALPEEFDAVPELADSQDTEL